MSGKAIAALTLKLMRLVILEDVPVLSDTKQVEEHGKHDDDEDDHDVDDVFEKDNQGGNFRLKGLIDCLQVTLKV